MRSTDHGLHIDKADHGAGAVATFDEETLDDAGGAQLALQGFGKAEEDQIALQLLRHRGILAAPAGGAEGSRRSHGLVCCF